MGLKTLLMLKQKETIKAFKGKLIWQDDFDKMKFRLLFWSTPASGSTILMEQKHSECVTLNIDLSAHHALYVRQYAPDS